MQKTTVQCQSTWAVLVAAITAKFHAMFNSAVPVGYEDETGFHYGVQRDRAN